VDADIFVLVCTPFGVLVATVDRLLTLYLSFCMLQEEASRLPRMLLEEVCTNYLMRNASRNKKVSGNRND
jgi:hypothetical protein